MPSKQAEIDQQQFRCLQNAEKNVRDKVANTLAMLRNWMDDYNKPSSNYPAGKVLKYIDNLNASTHSFRLLYEINKSKTPSDSKKGFLADTLVVVGEQGITIRLHHGTTMMEMDYSHEQFFGPVLKPGIFDQYLVFRQPPTFRDPALIYQTFAGGTSNVLADSLHNDKSIFSLNQVKDVHVAGRAYKLFVQQFTLPGGNVVTIAGLMDSYRYRQQRNRLPGELNELLLLIAFCAIFCLPWLKLFQMGSKDRLTTSDGLYCLSAPLLLVTVLMYGFMQFGRSMRNGHDAFIVGTRVLEEKLERRFNGELNQTYTSLENVSLLIDSDEKIAGPKGEGGLGAETANQIAEICKPISVKRILTLDKFGIEQYRWEAKGIYPPPGDYHDREYFRELLKVRPSFHAADDARKPYGLEQVISRATGKFTTVMCIPSPSKSGEYTAISFTMHCLNNVVLPEGFSFAVINDSGKTVYDSDTARQLNENLFDECSDRGAIVAAVRLRTDSVFNAGYSGVDSRFAVHPLKGLPYSLIITEPNIFLTTRMNNQFFSCLCLLGVFFFLVFVQALIVFQLSVKPRYSKKHYFDTSWIIPDDRFGKDYNLSFYGNGLIVILAALTLWLNLSFIEEAVLLLSATSISYINQSVLYVNRYPRTQNNGKHRKWRAVRIISIGWIIVDIITLITLKWRYLIVFQILASFCFYIVWWLYFRTERLQWIGRLGKKDICVSYSMMIMVRIMLIGVLPVVLFFTTVYNYGMNMEKSYRQSITLNRLDTLGVHDDMTLGKVPLYVDRVWITDLSFQKQMPAKLWDNDSVGSLPIRVLHRLASFNNQWIPEFDGFDRVSADSSRISSRYGDTTWLRLSGGPSMMATSKMDFYKLPWFGPAVYWWKPAGFWLLLASILVLIWYMLLNVVRKLSAKSLPRNDQWLRIDNTITSTNSLNKLLFLIGAPGSSKLSWILEQIKSNRITGLDEAALVVQSDAGTLEHFFVADMILIPNSGLPDEDEQNIWNAVVANATAESCKLVIVNHFEYDIKNQASTRIKLNFLENILQRNSAKVIIVSTVHPVTFLDSLNRTQQSQGAATIGTTGTPEHDLERWHVLLGHFRIVTKPLRYYPPSLDDPYDWQTMLRHETRSSDYMHQLFSPIHDVLRQGSRITDSSILLKLDISAHYFYNYIWQSLTREEKFILYDLAEDGLVNTFDDYNVILLISKGIIVRRHGVLHLFNRGVREFILTAIGPTEAALIQTAIRDNGNWNKLKGPLVLLIAAVLVFLFASQKDAYADLLKYIAVITVGIPSILKVFSLFQSTPPSATGNIGSKP